MKVLLAPGGLWPEPAGVPLAGSGTGLAPGRVASCLARGWRAARPHDSLTLLPMADGGPGSAQVIAPTMRSLVLPYVAALIAVVAAAATVALVVALSSSDMRPDLDTLDAIGAAPSMRRHVTTWQGVVLALNAIPTAVLSGLVVGVLAVITFANSGIFPTLTMTLRPIVPWGALLGMLIGMPILCALVAIILTPRHQKRIRRIN